MICLLLSWGYSRSAYSFQIQYNCKSKTIHNCKSISKIKMIFLSVMIRFLVTLNETCFSPSINFSLTLSLIIFQHIALSYDIYIFFFSPSFFFYLLPNSFKVIFFSVFFIQCFHMFFFFFKIMSNEKNETIALLLNIHDASSLYWFVTLYVWLVQIN